jgi:hypothetical protein
MILSKIYADYIIIFKVILGYYNFTKLEVLKDYTSVLYSDILNNKIITELPGLELTTVSTFIQEFTELNENTTLGIFNSDLNTGGLQMKDYFEGSDTIYYLAGVKSLLDKIVSLIGD